jgi:hypothetical protein
VAQDVYKSQELYFSGFPWNHIFTAELISTGMFLQKLQQVNFSIYTYLKSKRRQVNTQRKSTTTKHLQEAHTSLAKQNIPGDIQRQQLEHFDAIRAILNGESHAKSAPFMLLRTSLSLLRLTLCDPESLTNSNLSAKTFSLKWSWTCRTRI